MLIDIRPRDRPQRRRQVEQPIRPRGPVMSHRPQREGRFEAGGSEPECGHQVIRRCRDLEDVEISHGCGPDLKAGHDLVPAFRARVSAVPPSPVATVMPRRGRKNSDRRCGDSVLDDVVDSPRTQERPHLLDAGPAPEGRRRKISEQYGVAFAGLLPVHLYNLGRPPPPALWLHDQGSAYGRLSAGCRVSWCLAPPRALMMAVAEEENPERRCAE